MSVKFVKVEVLQGKSSGDHCLCIQAKYSGTVVAGSKPWGGGRAVHSYEVNVEELINAIKMNAYEKEDPQ